MVKCIHYKEPINIGDVLIFKGDTFHCHIPQSFIKYNKSYLEGNMKDKFAQNFRGIIACKPSYTK